MWQSPEEEGKWTAIWVSKEEISRQRENHLEGYDCEVQVSKARKKSNVYKTAGGMTDWIIRGSQEYLHKTDDDYIFFMLC